MFCGQCGTQVVDGAKFCANCGGPLGIVQAQTSQMVPIEAQPIQVYPAQAQPTPPRQNGGLCCPTCGSTNVQVQLVEQGQQTTKKGVGFGGHVNNTARALTAIGTLGMSNLVWKKSKGTNKTKTVHATVAICQYCGNSWEVKKGYLGAAPASIFR